MTDRASLGLLPSPPPQVAGVPSASTSRRRPMPGGVGIRIAAWPTALQSIGLL